MERKSLRDRFDEKVERTPDCWIWKGATTGTGGAYGKLWSGPPQNKLMAAHRISYELFVGEIPDGLEIDHLCFNRLCVNPFHLEAVTPAENVRRSVARITHCPSGHAYDEENTYTKPSGGRLCRACNRERLRVTMRERRARTT